MDNPLPPLAASVLRLRELVRVFDIDQLESASYPAGWTIADFAPENAEDEVTSERLARYRWLEGAWRRFLLPSPIDQFTPELRQALAAEE